jgi:PAS domain S-box-containing protein
VVYDVEGKVTFINHSFTDVFGWTLEEVLGTRMDVFVPKENRHETKMMMQSLLAGESFSGVETRRYSKEGVIVPVRISGSIYRDQEGHPAGRIINLRDVTEQKELEAQLQQAQKMEAIGVLAGGVAHDFSNVLQTIQGYAEILLCDKDQDDSAYAELHEIVAAVERGGKLARQLLTFSRKAKTDKRPVDLNLKIRSVRRLLERTIPKMIHIELQLAEDLRNVLADPAQLEQVIMNLAVNARDAMPEGGRIIIETKNLIATEDFWETHPGVRPGEYVLILISDTGHGMDKETLEHVFEPFYTTKAVGKGTGLGLAIAYGIVKSHEGHITCESRPGVGATFAIYLPAAEGKKKGIKPREREFSIRGGTETILLVDDEASIRKAMVPMLRRFGYTVLTAADGESALTLYAQDPGRIHLVILDMIMPGMGGRRCLEELLKIDPHGRILIASGSSAKDSIKEVMEIGAKGFLGKPYSLKQMLERVRKVLDED